MTTPGRSREKDAASRRVSRLSTVSSFTNPFKRRGSNAAVFTTPSASDFSFQQLADIGFPDSQLVVAPPVYSNSTAFPARNPLLRSSTCSNLPMPAPRMPDSPRPVISQKLQSQTSQSRSASRIPTPSPRYSPQKTPYHQEKLGDPAPEVVQAQENIPASLPGHSLAVPGGLVSGLRRSRTTSSRPDSKRLSSYEIIHHHLLKPKSPATTKTTEVSITSVMGKTNLGHDSAMFNHDISHRRKSSPQKPRLEIIPAESPLGADESSSAPVLPLIKTSSPFGTTAVLDQVIETLPTNSNESELSPQSAYDRFGRDSATSHTQARNMNDIEETALHDVFDTRPTAYWTGRFVSLQDRLMTEAHDLPDPGDANGDDKMLQLEIRRAKSIFTMLKEYCKTPLAETSLKHFRRSYALQARIPSLLEKKSRSSGETVPDWKKPVAPRSSGETVPDWRSLSDASTCAMSVDSAPFGIEEAERLRLTRMRSSGSASLTFVIEDAPIEGQDSPERRDGVVEEPKSTFMERLLRATGLGGEGSA